MPESNQKYYLIIIDNHKSEAKPRGQQGAFPIEYVEFPDPGSKARLSDNSTYVSARYPLFTVYDKEDPDTDRASAELIEELDKILKQIRIKQEPTKVTLMSVKNQAKDGKFDITQYEPFETIELDNATVHLVSGSSGTYQVQADLAILGTGDQAKIKTEIDYKNRI